MCLSQDTSLMVFNIQAVMDSDRDMDALITKHFSLGSLNNFHNRYIADRVDLPQPLNAAITRRLGPLSR